MVKTGVALVCTNVSYNYLTKLGCYLTAYAIIIIIITSNSGIQPSRVILG